MARKQRKDRSEDAEIPISAMIDVVFLLLVYFIVTSKEVVDEALVTVNLPGPPDPNQKPPEPPPTVDVFILPDHYVYQGSKRDLSEMTSILAGIGGAMGADAIVNIKVVTKAKHESLVLLLDRMRAAGLEKFNIHTLKDVFNPK
jgi:biopolymer transport protein ExbD